MAVDCLLGSNAFRVVVGKQIKMNWFKWHFIWNDEQRTAYSVAVFGCVYTTATGKIIRPEKIFKMRSSNWLRKDS